MNTYLRIEVLTDDGWRGPMGALRRLGNRASWALRHEVVGLMDCVGAGAFGNGTRRSCRFAWTDCGWQEIGHRILQAFNDLHDSEVRVVQVSGRVQYEDEHQVALTGVCYA